MDALTCSVLLYAALAFYGLAQAFLCTDLLLSAAYLAATLTAAAAVQALVRASCSPAAPQAE